MIADNHCCACVVSHNRGSQVHVIKFVGLGDDPIICMEVFRYAVDAIRRRIAEYREEINFEVREQRIRNYYLKRMENGYALGFAFGMKAKYEEQFKQENQQASESMAIVMVKPKEVSDFMSNLTESKVRIQDQPDENAIREGHRDGYKFTPTKRISAETEAAV